MEFNIDPTFSVYGLVKRTHDDTAIMSHRRTMEVISHEIENSTINDHAETVVFSSFQRMSRFLPQVKRYEKLAQHAQHVYVFGIPDAPLPMIENITYVPLKPADQLAKEWFLVSYGKDYFSALATEELTHIDDPDSQRVFKGIWTFDLSMVSILHEWLSGIVGLRFEERPIEAHDFKSQVNLMSNTIGRMNVRLMDGKHGDLVNKLKPRRASAQFCILERRESENAPISDVISDK